MTPDEIMIICIYAAVAIMTMCITTVVLMCKDQRDGKLLDAEIPIYALYGWILGMMWPAALIGVTFNYSLLLLVNIIRKVVKVKNV